ncbi:MAG: cysteine hydrolase family protein [Burkholderiales bacterium]
MELLRTLDEKVAPGRAAVVTVDVQNDFCDERGFLGKCGAPMHLVKAMLPRLVALLDAARAHAVPVIHVISYHDEEYASPVVTEQKLRHGLPMELDGRPLRDAPYCLKGSWGAELTAIKALPREEIVIKHRYSGFHGTNLDLVLRSRGIQTVILTGVATNACVESTARDTYMHDYYLVFVSDCAATTSQAAHDGTLANIDQFFGQVAASDAITAAWAAMGARPRAVAVGR